MQDWPQIWRQLQAGQPAGFEALLARLGPAVLAYLRRAGGDDALAEELFCQVWVRLVASAGRIRSPYAVAGYVFRIARNLLRNELARRRSDPAAAPADLAAAARPAPDEPVWQQLHRQEQLDRLRTAIAALPEPLRDVVTLRVYADLRFAEIAQVLELPLGTVLTRMRAAVKKLSKILQTREIQQ